MFKLPDLPYAYDALEPAISAETLKLHHAKHHAKYVETLNQLLADAGEETADLETIVRRAARDPQAKKLSNNASQAWNHTFFWTCMSPTKGRPDGELAGAIDRAFGGAGRLKEMFVAEGTAHFGSGWVWLAAEAGALKLLTTHDGDDVLTRPGMTALLTCDLWEHAYYLDYRNAREGFLEAWFDQLPNWTFAAAQYAAARGLEDPWKHPAPTAKPGTAPREQRSSQDKHV